jgi:hypothetical protein
MKNTSLVSGTTTFEKSYMHQPDEIALARTYRVRILMAELGKFIRGCEIGAITLMAASPLRIDKGVTQSRI